MKTSNTLPRKVPAKQRPRGSRKEEEIRKKQPSLEEVRSLKRCHTFFSSLVNSLDPFTTDEIEVSLSRSSSQEFTQEECSSYFKEYIQDPHKHKKSKVYTEFIDIKKRFDLIWNREDPAEEESSSERFKEYEQFFPSSQSTQETLNFLSELRSSPVRSRHERKIALKKAFELSQTESEEYLPLEEILENFPLNEPETTENKFSQQQKIILLRAVLKHLGDWDKILKEFKDNSLSLHTIKKEWRRLKGIMKFEVKNTRLRSVDYHYLKWLRAAIRKLESQVGKKSKTKNLTIIDASHPAKRIDLLSLMAHADEVDMVGIAGVKELPFSTTTPFKPFNRENDQVSNNVEEFLM